MPGQFSIFLAFAQWFSFLNVLLQWLFAG